MFTIYLGAAHFLKKPLNSHASEEMYRKTIGARVEQMRRNGEFALYKNIGIL